jgi:hypothetical protein
MTGKKSFILYADIKGVLDKLPNDKAGELFKTIVDYVNDLNPEPEDLVVQIAFENVRQQLKRDLKKWSKTLEQKSSAGKLSAAQRSLFSTGVQQSSTDSTDNVTVSDTDTVKWDKLIEVYNLIFNRNCKVISESIRKKYRARLKDGYTKKDIVQAMKNAKKDEYHISTDHKYCTLEFFSRPDKLDRFINQADAKYVPTK